MNDHTMSVDQWLKKEISELEVRHLRFNQRHSLLQIALRDWKSLYKHYRSEYESVSKSLNTKYPRVGQRTVWERQVTSLIQTHTRLQYFQNLWIGNHNIDIFFPSIAGDVRKKDRRLRGLAIEVDGPIHDSTLKMKKDYTKQGYLHSLGIGLYTIENMDVSKASSFRRCMEGLATLPRIDSRARKRLWFRIYLETLIHHLSDEDLNGLLARGTSKYLT